MVPKTENLYFSYIFDIFRKKGNQQQETFVYHR